MSVNSFARHWVVAVLAAVLAGCQTTAPVDRSLRPHADLTDRDICEKALHDWTPASPYRVEAGHRGLIADDCDRITGNAM